MTGVPFLSLQGELELNPNVDPLQNEALVQMWLEVKIRPLLKSITRHFLSCLSTKNFSCATYQTVYVLFPPLSVCVGLFCLFFLFSIFSPSCRFLQGEGPQPVLLRYESNETAVDLHILHVPLPVSRRITR